MRGRVQCAHGDVAYTSATTAPSQMAAAACSAAPVPSRQARSRHSHNTVPASRVGLPGHKDQGTRSGMRSASSFRPAPVHPSAPRAAAATASLGEGRTGTHGSQPRQPVIQVGCGPG
jgi:hypothetical protein